MYAKSVIDYLKSGKTLEDLNCEYGIKSTLSKDEKLVILNYSQIDSDMSQEICQACRGLILEVGTYNLVSRSFPKFFNYGESNAAILNESNLRIYEKLDGSLVEVYYYKDSWRIATKGSPDASGPLVGTKTFSDLIHQTIRRMGYKDLDSFMEGANKSNYYTFELTTPENQIVVLHSEYKLTLIGRFDSEKELPLDTRWITARSYDFSTLSDVIAASKVLNGFLQEGYVVCDASYNRVKIKSPEYIATHRLVSDLKSTRGVALLCLQEDYDDIIPLVPSGLREYIEDSRKRTLELIAICNKHYKVIIDHLGKTGYEDERAKKKRFATIIKDYLHRSVLFEMYKGRDAYQVLCNTHIDTVISLAGLKSLSTFLLNLDKD
jgi:hypothetical protein